MITPEVNKYNSLIFLDLDGVLNCELFYTERYKHLTRYDNIPFYRTVKRHLLKLVKSNEISKLDYYDGEMCPDRMKLLNNLCIETNSAVVLSASMRSHYTPEELQVIFNHCGATFTIIDKTPYTGYARGTEIHQWLYDHTKEWFGVDYYDFYKFLIFDDDSDMHLNQQYNFFQCDNYTGLIPTIVYKAKRFLTHKTF